MTTSFQPKSALDGVRVIDLSRILAGPTCTQILGDLGADVIKIEKPGEGDDTRRWGPPFVTGADGEPTTESAYYLCANRNKRSVEIDFTTEKGLEALLELLADADILVENFKTGTLARYGLGYAELKERFPRLIYCSITGFGQTGPYSHRAGYDFLAQAMGGIMSVTGEPDGMPMKVGVGVTDVTTGLYATIGILAALRHQQISGQGQQIDVCLLDTQVSWLVNEATSYLVSGVVPHRRGNEHPTIAPYKVYATNDGHVCLCVGNDSQFRKWCEIADIPLIAQDPRFSTNPARLKNRSELDEVVAERMASRSTLEWIEALEAANVPAGPINTIGDVFADEHVLARGMRIEMDYPHSASGKIALVGSPLKLSATPVQYRLPPPLSGEHTADILMEE